MAKPYPTDVIERAQNTLNAWKMIDDSLAFGSLDPACLSAEIDSAGDIQASIDLLEIQLVHLRNQRDSVFTSLWDKLKRIK